jgi:L-aspartate oxidase
LSEALRGEGARLVNHAGEPFMSREDPAGDLAPRDRVARAIVREVERTGAPVYLTLQHLPAAWVRGRFPTITTVCREAGLDLATDRIPVSPAAHYLMGGVATDVGGRTSAPGLYAAGEAACTGVHGANRLASKSLLEGLVFGGLAAEAMHRDAGRDEWRGTPIHVDPPAPAPAAGRRSSLPLDVRELMWSSAGVFRGGDRLKGALAAVEPAWQALDAALRHGEPADASTWCARNLLVVSRLIARAALEREESRGAHWRHDFPRRDDLHWRRHRSETRDGGHHTHV